MLILSFCSVKCDDVTVWLRHWAVTWGGGGGPQLIELGFIGRVNPPQKGTHNWEVWKSAVTSSIICGGGCDVKAFPVPFYSDLQVSPGSRNRHKVSTTEADIRDIVQDNAGQHLSSGRT
jgi:hypothetical protein